MLARLKVTAAWRPFESLRLGVQTREKFINRKRGAQQVDANDGEAVTRHTAKYIHPSPGAGEHPDHAAAVPGPVKGRHLELGVNILRRLRSPGVVARLSQADGGLGEALALRGPTARQGGGFHRSPSVADRSCEKDRYCFGGDRDHCVDAHAHSDPREAQDQRLEQHADVLEICELRQQLSLLN